MAREAELDPESCYRAVLARDGRFDGRFFTAVTTTGIYCRPSCPSRTPLRANVRFYSTAAAAVAAGFRACKRCRPDSLPGSREWDHRFDLVARALRLVGAGEVDEHGVHGLADRLSVSERHLHRSLVSEIGVGPSALARTRRAQTARLLIDQTDLAMTEIAFASGFSSIRQFNDVMLQEFGCAPSQLRRTGRGAPAVVGAGGTKLRAVPATESERSTLVLRLRLRDPYAGDAILGFLAARAAPGVEDCSSGVYRSVLRTAHGSATAAVTPGVGHATVCLDLPDLSDLGHTVAGLRRLFDLDADPAAVDRVLARVPPMTRLVATTPGLRVPGSFDGFELAVRAVLGQQVSLSAARTFAGRLASVCGTPLPGKVGSLTTAFPSADAVAGSSRLDEVGLTGARTATVRLLAERVASGDLRLDPGADRDETRTSLLAVPGIGSWTVAYIAMRALADPDAWPASDLVLRRAAATLGLEPDAAALRPWRAYGAMHLWQSSDTMKAEEAS